MRRDRVVIDTHGQGLKKSPNLPISRIIHELRGIRVNMGRSHRELWKILMFSSNLIKSDDESVIEIVKKSIFCER